MVFIKKSDINYIDIGELIVENNKKGKEIKPENKEDVKKYNEKERTTNIEAKELHKLFQQKENCLFLTGAGISVGSGLPLMWHLWQYFSGGFLGDELKEEKEKIFFKRNNENFKIYTDAKNHEVFNEFAKKFGESENVESFLSKILLFIDSKEFITITDENKEDEEIKKMIIEIKKAEQLKLVLEIELKKLCFINNEEGEEIDSEYKYFLQYLTTIRGEKNKSRLKIFTLNYDLLFEKTASDYLYTIIDGFSFTSPRLFASSNFDLDIVEKKDNRLENNTMHPRVFHLYKMHGSLNWIKEDNGNIKMNTPNNHKELEKDNQGLLIFPGKAKYEESYNMPYFEMLTRFQFELRKKETVLNIIGYGFGDTHINQMIFEALKNNPSLTINLFSGNDGRIYSFEEKDSIEYLKLNEKIKNLELLYPYFGMKRINIYNLRFWGLVNLLEIYKPQTSEQELVFKLFPHLNFNNSKDD